MVINQNEMESDVIRDQRLQRDYAHHDSYYQLVICLYLFAGNDTLFMVMSSGID